MKRIYLFVALLLLVVKINATPTFIEGRDYKLLPSQISSNIEQEDTSKISVTEFFSYGCPWCYKLEGPLKKWRQRLPQKVDFKRVPVVFHRGWDVYAKAYYAAELLGIENVITPNVFKAVQKNKQKLDTNKAMMEFFISLGIKKQIAESAFYSSPTVNEKVTSGMRLMQQYHVNAVPSFIVANKYSVNIEMSGGDPLKLFSVIDFLIAKEMINDITSASSNS